MNIESIAAVDYVGFLLLMAVLYSSRIRRKEPKIEFKIFTVITVMSAIACVVDFLTFFCDGKKGFLPEMISLFGNVFCFMANPLFILSWCIFTDMRLYDSVSRIKRIYRIAAIPALVLSILAFLNLFVPVFFYLDENNVYHRLPLSYMLYVIEGCYIILSFVTLKRYEKRYDKMRFFPIFLMIGPVALGCLIQLFFYGLSLIWVSVSVGITSIYMSLQNEFSYIDTLTGLYNRAYLDYVLEIRSKDKNYHLGGIMIDVDYFKSINDNFGHSVGDEALIDVARVIRLAKNDDSIAIRFAGDEFIVITKNSSKELLEKIVAAIREEVRIFNENEDRQYKLSLSIGYTLFDYGKDNSDSFFKHMDDNMYVEKATKHSKR